MKVTQLVADDDAVSPVIGVILMVAITVILAAVIGTFVLGIGQDQNTTPSATFDFNTINSSAVQVTHTGGDSFTDQNTGTLNVSGSNTTVWADSSSGFPVEAGDSVDVGGSSGDTIRVIWSSPSGGKTNTVGSFTVP